MFKRILHHFFREKWTAQTYAEGLLAAALLAQIVVLCIFNLTQLQYHVDFDASSNYLKSVLMWKQKALYVAGFNDQNILLFDSTAPVAALFYGLCGNIFIAYGISNILITALYLLVIWRILKQLGFSPLAALIVLNLFICPYWANYYFNLDLNYGSCMFFGAGFYSIKELSLLLMLTVLLQKERTRGNTVLAAVTLVPLLLCGMSSGFYILVTAILPLCLYLLICAFEKKSLKSLFDIRLAYAAAFACTVFAGKLISSKAAGFQASDMSMAFTGLTKLCANIQNVILGYIRVFGAGNPESSGISLVSVQGAGYFFSWLLLLFCLAGLVYSLVAIAKKKPGSEKVLPFLCVILTDFLLYCFLDVTYSGEIYEVRYMLHIFIASLFLAGYMADNMRCEGLGKRALSWTLAASLLFVNAYSDIRYFTLKNAYFELASEMSVSIADHPSCSTVYIYGDQLMYMARNFRVYDTERIYKHLTSKGSYKAISHWGDYLFNDEAETVSPPVLLIAEKSEYSGLPEFIRNDFSEVTTVEYLGQSYALYKSEVCKFDFWHHIGDAVSVEYAFGEYFDIAEGNVESDTGFRVLEYYGGAPGLKQTMQVFRSGFLKTTVFYDMRERGSEPGEFRLTVGDKVYSAELTNEGEAVISGIDITDAGSLSYELVCGEGEIIAVDKFLFEVMEEQQ